MKSFYIAIIAGITLQFSAVAQPMIIAPTLTGNLPGTMVTVPIHVSNFDSLVELSLILHFDPAVVQFQEFTNENPLLNVGNLFMNSVDGNLYVTWYTFDPLTIPDGQIFNLVFNYFGGISPFVWDTIGTTGTLTFQNGVVAGPMTGISPDHSVRNNCSIYPNPANDIVNIDFEKPVTGTLVVFDFTGKAIISKEINDQTDHEIIPISELKSGTYFVRISSNEGTAIELRKLVVE